MKNILFRLFFIYFFLTITPWLWFDEIPGVTYVTKYYNVLEDWIVNNFNKHLFHIKDTLVPMGGSGDTSYGWALLFTSLSLSAIGCLGWSLIDRKQQNYDRLDFWLRNMVRYYVAIISFSYGIIKLFALQMYFPNLSQLATPLGNFLPMRLSWMFIGYSTPYQVFSGIMETVVGILLLNRKTITFGSLLGIGVFTNVVMLNLSYDIPVKIFSIQLFICCLFLIVKDSKRVLNFFLFNKIVEPDLSYEIQFEKRWQKIIWIAWKIGFILLFVLSPFYQSWNRYKEIVAHEDIKPIKSGIYDVKCFVKNNDTIPISVKEELAWKDFIFDKDGIGSVNSLDTLFRQRYLRGYFIYQPDSINKTIAFKKFATDSLSIFKMRYQLSGDSTIQLWGKVRNDSLYFNLLRSKRYFQLAERQFHWLSESIR